MPGASRRAAASEQFRDSWQHALADPGRSAGVVIGVAATVLHGVLIAPELFAVAQRARLHALRAGRFDVNRWVIIVFVPNDQHRAATTLDHAGRHGTEQQALHSLAPVCPHDDHVRLEIARQFHDQRGGVAALLMTDDPCVWCRARVGRQTRSQPLEQLCMSRLLPGILRWRVVHVQKMQLPGISLAGEADRFLHDQRRDVRVVDGGENHVRAVTL